MDLITTHINADFDALGSMVAAKKLYPDSRLLLPGSPEESVRKFLSLAKELISVESEKECRLDDVTRLILVDTRHKSRIGIAAELVDKGAEIVIYDHHPAMKGDIVADKDISEEVGASVTALAEIIKNKGIGLSPLEATVMLLGIYEETGSLTFRTTTKLDVDMVSFLLSQGANLSMVASYLNRELTEKELSLLVRLINSTEKIIVNGISVTMIEMSSDSYVGELGMIIHKLMEIENIPVLFVLIDTLKGRVDVIGRSSVPIVDMNKVLSNFGGGGHPGAASAKVRNMALADIKERLIKILKNKIKTKICAGDIMSGDVRVLDANQKIDEVANIFKEGKVSSMPVVDKDTLVGIMKSDGINKAIKSGFGHSRLKGYMSRDIFTARPDTPLYDIQKMMTENDIGVLPIVKNKKVIGVVSRTDVLKSVHQTLFLKPPAVDARVVSNLLKKMVSVLPAEIMGLLKNIGNLANSVDYRAFVVGGLVRDLELGVKNLDLDIVVEGDAIKLGQELAKELGASLVIHRRFGTCSVITKDRFKIDLATARKEIYEHPAALPKVQFSSLKDDLIRRDFTVNAMAISINKDSFGQLIDFFNGEEDLSAGRIRVMHDGSFIDDPTRIFRAVRFESRFAFRIDAHTEELIKTAIKKEMFDKVAPQRIRDEIELILKEKDPLKSLKRMAQLDELRFLHPGMKLSAQMVRLYGLIDKICAWYNGSAFRKRSIEKWLMYLMALTRPLSYKETVSFCDKFSLRRGEKIRMVSYKKDAGKILEKLASKKSLLPSKIYCLLEPLSFEVILMIAAEAESGRGPGKKLVTRRIEDFFRKYNGMRISVKGEDLQSLGLKPCPEFKTIMKKVLYEKLDGKLKNKNDEIGYAKKIMGRICPKGR